MTNFRSNHYNTSRTRNDDQDDDPDFGEKFLGVKTGGSLEIHGPYKKSWSKLDGTLTSPPTTFLLGPSDSQPPRGSNQEVMHCYIIVELIFSESILFTC